jgi:hypothetical protein
MMNERIKQLEAQARVYAVKQNETTSMPYSQAYAEKYVELMERMVLDAIRESEWFHCKANNNQLTQEYVARKFRES